MTTLEILGLVVSGLLPMCILLPRVPKVLVVGMLLDMVVIFVVGARTRNSDVTLATSLFSLLAYTFAFCCLLTAFVVLLQANIYARRECTTVVYQLEDLFNTLRPYTSFDWWFLVSMFSVPGLYMLYLAVVGFGFVGQALTGR